MRRTSPFRVALVSPGSLALIVAFSVTLSLASTVPQPNFRLVSTLDGGQAVLPDVLVTSLLALPNGTVYAGGHIMVRSTLAYASPPVVPAGSVWLMSRDHGAHWSRSVNTIDAKVVQQAASGTVGWTNHHLWPADFTVNALAADPRHPNTIYAAGCSGNDVSCLSTTGRHRLLRSSNGGATWSDALTFNTTSLLYTGLSHLTTNIVKSPALDAILRLGPAQLPGQALDVVIDPLKSRRIYACMSGIGVLRSDDGAQTWRYSDAPQYGWENAPCDLLIVQHHPAVLFSVDRPNGRVYRSQDAGRTWSSVSTFGYRSKQHLYKPTLVNGVLFVAGYKGIYASHDYGMHWSLAIPTPSSGTMAMAVRVNSGWIAAFKPTDRSRPIGLYGKPDGQPWRIVANTSIYGSPHFGGAMDFQAMQADARTRLWADPAAHFAFTAGAVGGLWRWNIGLRR